MDLNFLVCFIVYILTPVYGTWTPSPEATWTITNADNETCLLLSGTFVFTIPYLESDGQYARSQIKLPQNGEASGNCTTSKQELLVSWSVQGSNATLRNAVRFLFSQNGTHDNSIITGYFQLIGMTARFETNPIDFPNSDTPDRIYDLHVSGLKKWIAPVELSYYCDSEEEIYLSEGGSSVLVSHVQAQPFHVTPLGGNPSDFAFRSYCGSDVSNMMTNGLLFIILLFLVSIAIVLFLQWQKRVHYYSF